MHGRGSSVVLPLMQRVLLGVFLLVWRLHQAFAHEPIVTVGIVPQRSALELAWAWTPLLRHVGRVARCHLHFETAKDIPAFQARVARGMYGLVYLNPAQYVIAHQQKGYRALVQDNGHLRPILVVGRTSRIQTLAGLAYHAVAFPAPGSLAASMLPQRMLKHRHIPIRIIYVGSHGSVYRSVADGLYVAGGGIIRTFVNFPSAVRDHLRILWIGAPLPPHPFAVLPTISQALVVRLRQAFLALSGTTAGRMLLARIGVKRFVPTTNAEYDAIRRLTAGLAMATH